MARSTNTSSRPFTYTLSALAVGAVMAGGAVFAPLAMAETTPAPSASASASASPSASATASTSPQARSEHGSSGSAASASTASLTQYKNIVWVVDPEKNRLHFTGPVTSGGDTVTSAALTVTDSEDNTLGTITTDENAWLGDSVALPKGWSAAENYRVSMKLPGDAGSMAVQISGPMGVVGESAPSSVFPEKATAIVSKAEEAPQDEAEATDDEAATNDESNVDDADSGQDDAAAQNEDDASAGASPQASTEVTENPVPADDQQAPVAPATDDEVTQDPAPADEPQPIYVRDTEQQETAALTTEQAPAPQLRSQVADRLADTGGPALVASLVGMGVAGAGVTLVGNGVAERRHRRRLNR